MINNKINGTLNSLCAVSTPEVIDLFLKQQNFNDLESFEYKEFIINGFLSACNNDNKQVINYLLENEHVLPREVISHVMYRGNLEILKLLISSIDLEDPYDGIAELAYDSCALGHVDILEHFVNSPILKEKTIESITEQFGLWAAYQEDRTQMVEFLLYNLNIQPPSNYKQEIKTLSQTRIDEEDWTLQEANEKTLSFITMIEKRDKIFKSALDTTENLLNKVSKSSNDLPKPKLI